MLQKKVWPKYAFVQILNFVSTEFLDKVEEWLVLKCKDLMFAVFKGGRIVLLSRLLVCFPLSTEHRLMLSQIEDVPVFVIENELS